MKKYLLFLFAMMMICGYSFGQTTLLNPTGNGGFDLGGDFTANGWTVVNGTTNMLYVGSAPVVYSAPNCAFSGSSSTTWAGTANANVNHFYRSIPFPAGETSITLKFRYKIAGPDATYDYLKVWLTSSTPVAGTQLTSTQIGGTYDGATTWTEVIISIPGSYANTTTNLVFSWRTDAAAPYAAIAIDNIELISKIPDPLHGSYTIDNTLPTSSPMVHDGTGNFNSFTNAISVLNGEGISAAVTFNVKAGQTFNEKPPAITATGTVTNTITFVKNGGAANPKITPVGTLAASPYDFGFCISGGDYITFDGIDVDASAATNTTNAIEYGYLIRNASATNGAQYNTIKNCSVTLNKNFVPTTTSGCIFSSVNTSQGGFIPSIASGANSYNKYYNLTLQNAQNGVYLAGYTTYPDISCEIGVAGSGCQSARNTISNIGGVYTYGSAYGIYIYALNNVKIFNNDISAIAGNQATGYGIWLTTGLGTGNEIYNNKIQNVSVTGTASTTSAAYGFRADLSTTGTNNLKVYNNFISNVYTSFTGSATISRYAYGMFIGVASATTSQSYDLDNNSISIGQGLTPTYSNTCLELQNGSPIYRFRGNIFANFTNAQAGVAKHFGIIATAAGLGGTGTAFDYNDYFIANGQGASGHVGRNGSTSTNYNTVADWKAFTTGTLDETSISVDPGYSNNNTDLHASAAGVNAVSGFSAQAWVATDIDCNDRSLTSPSDLGADAFTINDQTSKAEAPTTQVTGITFASTVTTIGAAVDVFRFKITDVGPGDGLATKVTNIRIQNANPANGASWTANIAGLKLNDGTSDITIGTPVITTSYIDVPVTSGNLDVANGTSKTITMSVYLKTSGIEDGKKLQFTIPATGHGFTAAGSGSLFSTDFGTTVTSNEHTIAVEATQLVFGTIPSNVLINANFIVTVNASDANGNPDTDNNSSVTLSKSTGTGLLSSVTGLVHSLSGGTYTWTDVQYNASGNFKIQAAASLLIPVISGDIAASNEVQIGTGTSLYQAYPFDVYWGFSRNSALYTTSEIGAYRVIEKLSWQIATPQTTVCPVKIYLKKTTATTVVADTWANMIAGATLVYDGSVQFTPSGWFSFNLSTPFNYDADNLLVLTEGNYGGGGTTVYPTFYYTSATTMNANIHTDNTPPTASLAVGNNRPNIKISFQQPMEYISSTATQTVTSPIMLSGINQEIIGLQIVTNGTGNPLTVSSFDFSSAGTTDPDNDLVTARLWSTGSSPVFATTLQVGNAYSGPWGSFSITSGGNLPFTLSGGTNYFWLTYDVSGSATIGNLTDAQFNGVVVGGNPYTPTVQDPPGSRTIKGPLSGNYTIGVAKSSDYSSLTGINGFFADVNSLGLAGNVTATVVTDLVEDGTFSLSQWTESGAGNYSLIIQPNEAVNKTISGSSASGLIRLSGADRVTIDGSYNGSGRYLSFSNTNAGTSSAVIWIFSTSASNGATNNTIKNCNLTGNSSNTTLACIVSSSGATIGGVAEAQNNNNTYQNNIIKKSFYGIAVVGPSGNETGVLIADNSIGSTTFADKIGLVGIGLYQQSGTVSGNSIFGVTTASTSTASGILVAGSTSNISIKENSITDVKNTNTVGWGSNGMQLNSSSTTANVTIINNMISDVASYGYSSAAVGDNGYGIIAVSGGGYNIYFNSINLNTNQSALLGLPSAINITSGITGAGSIDLRNNIIANTQTFGTNRYAIYCAAASTVFSNIDYNDYYTTGPNLGYLGGTILDLPAWQTATGMDEKSISGDPKFIDPTNLHINTAVISPVSAAGKELESVVADIDGDLRNNPPDIGADEFLRTGPATKVTSVVGCPGNLVVVPVIVNNFTNVGTISLTLDYNPAVLTFQGLTTSSIPSTWDTNYQASSGRFIMGGFGPGLTLPNGSVLFNLTFMYHGGTGALTWFDDDGISCEYSDATTLEPLLDLPFSTYYTNGTVSQQKTLYLSLFLEGLYSGEHLMNKAQNGLGDQFGGDTADMITVELHNVLAYSDPPAYVDGNVKLGTNGQAMVCIPDGFNDFYYITIKHRNSIETTTAESVSFSGNIVTYSFDEPSKAYGDNLAVFIDGTAAIYAGDENQDDIVDGSDLSDVANLVPTAPCGYIKEDINGDGLIDGSDLSITGNNSAFAIIAITP